MDIKKKKYIYIYTLCLGIHVLNHTAQEMQEYCRSLAFDKNINNGKIKSNINMSIKKVISPEIRKEEYLYVSRPVRASFAEAGQRCQAQHMQLPEIYSSIHGVFLWKKRVSVL